MRDESFYSTRDWLFSEICQVCEHEMQNVWKTINQAEAVFRASHRPDMYLSRNLSRCSEKDLGAYRMEWDKGVEGVARNILKSIWNGSNDSSLTFLEL